MAGIKSDKWIRRMANGFVTTELEVKRISQFVPRLVNAGKGLLTYSVDTEDKELMAAFAEAGVEIKQMISPFEAGQVKKEALQPLGVNHQLETEIIQQKDVISYGTTSYGYDARCGHDFKVFTNLFSTQVDPKKFDPRCFVDWDAREHGGKCIIPPNSFALARTLETMDIPRDTLVVCIGKSTYARCGIIVNVTPLEPEWTGQVTLEFSNTTPLPAVIYANEGCMQMCFLQSDEDDVCDVSYGDRGGKYQGQMGVTLPKAF